MYTQWVYRVMSRRSAVGGGGSHQRSFIHIWGASIFFCIMTVDKTRDSPWYHAMCVRGCVRVCMRCNICIHNGFTVWYVVVLWLELVGGTNDLLCKIIVDRTRDSTWHHVICVRGCVCACVLPYMCTVQWVYCLVCRGVVIGVGGVPIDPLCIITVDRTRDSTW